MSRALIAGFCAFLLVFAAGFALGTLRVLALEPRFGALAATLVELPFMLAISWTAVLAMIRRFKVAPTVAARLIMGAVAFGLLIGAELLLGLAAFDGTLAEQLSAWRTLAGVVGLFAQFLFAAFPLLALCRRDFR
jgi:hypothetical protein